MNRISHPTKFTCDRRTVRLGDLITHRQELERDAAKAGFHRFLKVEHLDADRLRVARYGEIKNGDLPPTFYKVFRAGQVLYPTRNPHLRRTAHADFDGICGEKTLTLEANDQIEPRLLPFIFQTEEFLEYASSMAIGSTNPHVRWRDIAAFKFELPNPESQKRIADILWAADNTCERWTDTIGSLQRMARKSAFEQFSRARWKRVPLGDHVVDSAYGPRFSSDLYASDGAVGQIRTTDLLDDGTIIYETVPRVSLDPDKYTSHILKSGDFLISRSGTCGIGCVFERQPIPMVAGAFLIRFQLAGSLNPSFLCEYINSPLGRRQMEALSQGGVQQNLKGSSLLKELVPVPDVTTQNKVVEHLRRLRSHVAAVRQHQMRCMELKRGLIAALLGGTR